MGLFSKSKIENAIPGSKNLPLEKVIRLPCLEKKSEIATPLLECDLGLNENNNFKQHLGEEVERLGETLETQPFNILFRKISPIQVGLFALFIV